MKKICFYFQVHQPFRLRDYHFFDIGHSHNYFDDKANALILEKVARKCYLPANRILLDLIHQYNHRFKVSFSISGTALDQFERYAPEVIDSFKALADTGCVEFLAETNGHSLSVLKSREEFKKQVLQHSNKIKILFGQRPTVFRNTELIYSDAIGETVADMGYIGMLAEGAHKVLNWKSPNYLYCSATRPELRLLLKNFRLSDDIAFRFSNRDWKDWPLTSGKFVHWLNGGPKEEEIINLFMDYETFGEHQWHETGIFDFLKELPGRIFSHSDIEFTTPGIAIETMQPVGALSVETPVSWADEERDLSAWLGNDLQDDAFDTLYKLENKVKTLNNPGIQRDWLYLQTSDHFYYMCTKYFADGDVHKYFNHYNSPFDAFINYMNILTDFSLRIDKLMEKRSKRKIIIRKKIKLSDPHKVDIK
jgi:alpha-amylase